MMKTSTLTCLLIGFPLMQTWASSNELVIEEVIVTAQKRSESLQDVPVSVSALSGSNLEELRLRDTTEIVAQIPNLQLNGTAGDAIPIFSLRGISMNDYSFNQNSPVAPYVDEVYKGNPAFLGIQTFDLARIEVLRGPQGTLYGKNSTGGAVNFITAKPGPEREGYLTVGAGNFDRTAAEGAVNLPLADNLAIRVAGTWNEADGWLENRTPGVDDGNSIDNLAWRVSLSWQPQDTLEVLLRASGSEVKGINYGIVADNIGQAGVGAGVYGLYNALGATARVDGTREGFDFFDFNSEQDDNRDIENTAYSLTVNWDFSDTLTLTSITSYDEGDAFVPEDADGTVNTLINVTQFVDADQITQDLRLTSNNDGPFNFIAGVYYSEEDLSARTSLFYSQDLDLNLDGSLDFEDCSDPLFTAFGLPAFVTPEGTATDALFATFGLSLGDLAIFGCETQNVFDQERTSTAAYFDGEFAMNQSWTARFGIRFTEDETDLSNFNANILGNDGVLVTPTIMAVEDSISDGEVTGKLGIDYVGDDGTLYYANYSRGYRTGAFNAQAFLDIAEVTAVDPEELDALELGVKTSFAEDRVHLNASVFHYRYENQQFLNVDQNLIQTLVNIDESEIIGAEIEVAARLSPSLTIGAGMGMLDSEVNEGVLNGIDLSGNELPQSPDVNFNISADWDVVSSERGTLALHIDGSYTGEHYFEVMNTDRIQADAFWVVNGALTFESADSQWAVSLWGRNLFEEEYVTSAIDLQTFFGYDYTHVGAPRTYGLDLTLRM